MRKRNTSRLLFSGLCAALLLTGCTYESGSKQFPETNFAAEPETAANGESAAEWLKTALVKAQTDPQAQKFWYKGHVKNTILSRTTTSMFEGAVIKPTGYNVDARIARQPYQYYRIGDKRFVRVGQSWMTAQEDPLPFDPLKGFDDWMPFLDQAVQLTDDKVYGKECVRFQLKITGAQWLKKSSSDLFEPIRQQLAGRPDLEYILNESTIKTTFWIGKESHLLHQYETWIILPLPEAGTMDQQVLFQFYKYNDPGIKIKEPEEVEQYLLH
ncbi:hypothetical protein [Brevibacillus sp. H7]|uniref:hypothetical protein n=1 Tax=Brevibacillus sp. H7 TaxID=3349138 RepID=UPI00382D9F91